MTLLLGLFLTVGLFLCGVTVPLIRRKIPPNSLYGFRVKRTLEDPAVWYDVNAYAAKGLLGVGLGTCMAALVFFFMPGIDLVLFALLVGGVVLGGLAVNLILSFRYLARWSPR